MTATISTTGNLPALPSSSVLVVCNANVTESLALANYYMAARGVPAQNLLALNIAGQQAAARALLSNADYAGNVLAPIQAQIAALGGLRTAANPGGIQFVLLCPFISPAARDAGGSVKGTGSLIMGAYLAANSATPPSQVSLSARPAGYGYPFVTHLDLMTRTTPGVESFGYSLANVKTLVDRSMAAQPWKARVLLQQAHGGGVGQYTDNYVISAVASLAAAGKLNIINSRSRTFSHQINLIGLYWGGIYQNQGNDVHGTLRWTTNSYLPGAIMESLNSYGWTRYWQAGSFGHSAPDDLFAQGMTGGCATVEEPYVNGLANPGRMFQAYLSGFTLAEACWLAIPYMPWVNAVLGDPLCAPYHS